MNDDMQVWVGCLACYNDGRLLGRWVDAIDARDLTTEELHGGASTHEELWCFDSENLPIDGECSPDAAAAAAELIGTVGDREAFLLWRDHVGGEVFAESVQDWHDSSPFRGSFDSLADWAYSLAEDIESVDLSVWPYSAIDWTDAADELLSDGYFSIRGSDGLHYVYLHN